MVDRLTVAMGLTAFFLSSGFSSASADLNDRARQGRLSERQVQELRSDAVNGDASASLLLAYFYNARLTHNAASHLFYLRLSAEQGNCEAIYLFAVEQRRSELPVEVRSKEDWEARRKECVARMFD